MADSTGNNKAPIVELCDTTQEEHKCISVVWDVQNSRMEASLGLNQVYVSRRSDYSYGGLQSCGAGTDDPKDGSSTSN